MTITYALLEKLEEIEKKTNGKTARIITKAKATKLITNSNGAVVGLEYEKDGKTIKEEGIVVICSGGFAADFSDDSLLKNLDLTYFTYLLLMVPIVLVMVSKWLCLLEEKHVL